eukprot:TRINITY_DN69607_c0_g1_i1.p1 TRINITY_DN69607_c0_g1~~TRINITY_DN69607_c0_g1_i1.p1  ORF type:complete len:212 (+),score=21.13 TRINITY_DN69607_c0_g1_i1:93-728(+)
MFGVFLYRVLTRALGFSSTAIAILVVVMVVAHDLLEAEFGVKNETPLRWNVVRLAPVFGMQDAMTVKHGFGSLPWCTTNNVVTIAFAFADIILGGSTAEERHKMLTSFVMMGSMITGAIVGSYFDSYFKGRQIVPGAHDVYADYGIAVISPLLGLLMWMNGRFFAKPARTTTPHVPLLQAESKPPLEKQGSLLQRTFSHMQPVETTLHLSG